MILGLLVTCVVWGAVAPSGRPARELAGRRPARRSPGVRLLAWRRTGTGSSVRLVVAHVASLLRAGAVPDRGDLLAVVSARGSLEAEGQVAAVVAASRLAADVGAPLGEVLESIARALAAESEARADREASLAGPAATARVLLWLPLVGVLLGVALGVDPVATALGGGAGSAGLLAGAVLLLVGRRWSGRLVARARAVGAPP
ncbi:hypothetical protein [Oerskovia paurometabola]|uniref:hypothetical protein n=1 Tax=Oerskovia paurometabola TaxID=162170 RepID=UPI00381460C3